ncbi:hypothetical protein [Streptomyces sp. NPDC048385]
MTLRQTTAAHCACAFAEPGAEKAGPPAESFRQESGLLTAVDAV